MNLIDIRMTLLTAFSGSGDELDLHIDDAALHFHVGKWDFRFERKSRLGRPTEKRHGIWRLLKRLESKRVICRNKNQSQSFAETTLLNQSESFAEKTLLKRIC